MAKKKTTSKAGRKESTTRKTTRKSTTRKTARKKVTKKKVARKKATTRKAVTKKTAARKSTRKTAKSAKRKTTAKKKAAKTAVRKKTAARKKSTTTAARKKTTKKAARKATPKAAKKPTPRKKPRVTSKKPTPAAPAAARKPKTPRRTKQTQPPRPRIVPPALVEIDPLAPAQPPEVVPAPDMPGLEPPRVRLFGDVIDADVATPQVFASGPPRIGQPAPDFILPDQRGQMHRLSQYRGHPVVLYFYPRDNTPGCTVEACEFRDQLGRFDSEDVIVLGVSADDQTSHSRFANKFALTFPLLSDTEHAVAEAYGVWVEKKQYGRTYWGIARKTFVIDPDGCVARIFEKVRPQGHAQEILNFIAQLRG
jgi:peroxiredoxin Q/BCP